MLQVPLKGRGFMHMRIQDLMPVHLLEGVAGSLRIRVSVSAHEIDYFMQCRAAYGDTKLRSSIPHSESVA